MDIYSATVPNFSSVDANDDVFLSELGLRINESGIDPKKVNNKIQNRKGLKQNNSDICTFDIDSLFNSEEAVLGDMSSLSYDFVVSGEAFHLGEDNRKNNKNNVPVQQQQQRQHGAPQFSPDATSTNFETIVRHSLNQNQNTSDGLGSGVETGYINKFSPESETRRSPRRRDESPSKSKKSNRITSPTKKKDDKDQKYYERRRKNNLAAHKSRLKVKLQQQQIAEDNTKLILENEQLKTKVAFLYQEIEKLKSFL